ncbi:MAG TPA: RNA polymerase sigma factor [Candidatus Polarisedimenticolaceae bacterium]|nr:RNA polymerase sigma factor [Candidatus Polarisedimenticolaceae bacterium]
MEPTDDELIAEIGSGSDLAFDRLMRRYRRLVYRVAYGYTGDSDGALDVVQETFLKVHTRLGSFRGEGTLKSWIVRIAANEAMNWNRATWRFPTMELDESSLPRPDATADAIAGRTLTRSLAALGPKHRLAIVLRYYGERSTREIADALDCSEGTARNVLFRGLTKLRTMMTASQESLR